MDLVHELLFALLGGIFPALIWLLFWLREDSKHPEPRKYITYAFIAGMITVPFVIPFQKLIGDHTTNTVIMFGAWAFIEESFKLIAAYATVLWRKAVDEPIDALLYMIVVALGFAAFENALFLLAPIRSDELFTSIVTGNLRFIGSTLLHTVSSATIGIFIAFSFYKSTLRREVAALLGLCVATALHTFFNLSIIMNDGANMIVSFYSVWFSIIILILIFEKVKTI